jgi:hypothetical protein
MVRHLSGSPAQDDESRRQRVNRELIELLNELRVALPGVQVLFAFLLAVPFSAGYSKITSFQKQVFFVTLAATAVSTAFFMVGVIVLITDVIYSDVVAIVSGVVSALLFGGLWAIVPLARRLE